MMHCRRIRKTYRLFIEQGISRRDHEKISNMLRRGKTVEQIVDFCDYPYELVKKIEEDLLIDA